MITIQDISKLGGITDRDKMIQAVSAIPDEDLRQALILLSLAFNNSMKIDEAIDAKKNKEIAKLEKRIEQLEIELMKTGN